MTIRMHEWPRNQANLHASEQIISAGIFVGAMDWTYTWTYKTYYVTKL